jgi:hypothetical protein
MSAARPQSDAFDFDFLRILDFDVPQEGQQQRSIESRARIIATASEAFLDLGYTGVSTHEISAAAARQAHNATCERTGNSDRK